MDTTPAPAPSPMTPGGEKPKTSYGAVIGLLIIVAAIVIGALYFLKERVGDDMYTNPEDLSTQGTSTAPEDIEADLNAQSSDDFDREIDQAFVDMEAELSQ
jgi:hypothetical protein